VHLGFREIAANVAAFGKRVNNNKTGPFGPNRIASTPQLKRAALFYGKAPARSAQQIDEYPPEGTSF
jgi:hypothetical protein